MQKKQVLIILLMISAIFIQSCGNVEAAVSTGIAQTQQINDLQTAAAGEGGGGGDQVASNTPLPPGLPTDTPTITLTATSSIPYVSVSVDTHCRSGPRLDYTLLTTILVGEQVVVLATFPGADYVVVQRQGGSGSCWLWLRYATVTDFSGYNLPIATQPPTSTPTRTPSPTYTPSYTPALAPDEEAPTP